MANVEVKMCQWFDDHWYKVTLMNPDGKLEIRWIPSVTTKLGIVAKPFLAKWRGEIGNREADIRMREAQDSGSRIHHALNIYLQGGKVLYNSDKMPVYAENEIKQVVEECEGKVIVLRDQEEMFDIWKLDKFFEIVKPVVKETEMTVYNLEQNDAGTTDITLDIKEGNYMVNGSKPLFIAGGLYVVDLKTGSMIDDSAHRQTAAYLKCLESMGVTGFVGTIILHTGSKVKKGIEGLSTILRTMKEVEEDYKDYRLAAALWERTNKDASPRIFDFPSMISMNKGASK